MHRFNQSALALTFALAACADPSAPHSQAVNTLAAQDAASARIESDQDTIRFIVKGKEQARIDAEGFHVRQGIETGTGTLNGVDYDAAKP